MTANEWREKSREAAEVVELVLPSGMEIRARRPGPMQFAQWDRLPLVLAAIEGGGERLETEEVQEITHFMRELLIYCCVEPRVSVTPAEDEVHPREIPEADWRFIVQWGMRLKEAEALRPFRPERKDDRGDGDREAVFVPSLGAAGDRGSGDGAGVRPGGGATGDRAAEG